MERILYKGKLAAILVSEFPDGSNPVTDAKEPLQVMTLKRDKGEKVAPHRHMSMERKTDCLQECLVVRKGSARVDLFGDDGELWRSLIIKTGTVLIILGGWHGVEYLEPTEIVELKNGPFMDDKEFLK